MPRWFGTDGLRGKSFEYPLIPEVFRRIGHHWGRIIQDNGAATCLVAHDTRSGGDVLAKSLILGLSNAGVKVLDAGVLPTPAAILTAYHRSIYCAVITASHNLYPDNGLKLIGPDGRKVTETLESYLEERFDEEPDEEAIEPGAVEDFHEKAISWYTDWVHKQFRIPQSNNRPKLYLDLANGASVNLYPKVLRSLGYNVSVYNDQPNGENINQGCGAAHFEFLHDTLQHKFPAKSPDLSSIGFGYDGDGDRMLAVIPGYGVWDGQNTLAAGALYLLGRDGLGRKPAVVSTVMANQGLESFLAKYGIHLIRTPVGDKYIQSALHEHGLILGAEPSGHVIHLSYSPTGDGLLSTMFFLKILHEAPEIIQTVLQEFHPYPQVLKNVRAPARPPLEELHELQKRSAFHQARLAKQGRIFIRYSGTEAVLRILVEAQESVVALRVAEDLVEAAEKDFAKRIPT